MKWPELKVKSVEICVDRRGTGFYMKIERFENINDLVNVFKVSYVLLFLSTPLFIILLTQITPTQESKEKSFPCSFNN